LCFSRPLAGCSKTGSRVTLADLPILPMHPRLSRRGVLIAAPLALVFTVACCCFGPLVRAAARGRATRRHLALEVHSARPGWFSVVLHDLIVHPERMPGVEARVDRARVSFGLGLGIDRVELSGVSVVAQGTSEELRDQLAAWKDLNRQDPNPAAEKSRSSVTVAVDGLAVRWMAGLPPQPKAEFSGASAIWGPAGLRVHAAEGRARFGSAELTFTNAVGAIDPVGTIELARAAALVMVLDRAEGDPRPRRPDPDPSPPPLSHHGAEPLPVADPAAPLVPVPDTHALRGKVAVLESLLSDRIGEGADVGVDAMTWKIERADQVAFTLGPGPLALKRLDAGFELRFSTDPSVASTPLAVRAVLPKQGDTGIWLEGGPVSLSLLGVQEGAMGLVDVGRATMTGRAHVILADDGSSVTFDGEGGTRDLSIANPRLASDVVRGLDVQIRARGAATAGGDLRLDDFAATIGAIHVAAGGVLEQREDHVAGAFHLDIPTASCQSLLDSLPSALLPVLQGTRISGNFGAHGRFGFDTRSLDDLQLEYDVKDQCRVSEVPPDLARERFAQPFSHRIYLPDGTLIEEMTGPGSDNWTPLDEISPYMQVAVLTTEDGGFPKHHGFNRASIRSSIVANLKARRFARGASTITMQLAKNLFLSRDKTLARKLEEVVLTDYLEQTFTKDELMELYLNVIEFGPSVYGITAAAEHYFGRSPGELNLGECLFLSSLLPAPLRYGAMRENGEVPEGWMRTLHSLMQIAHKYGRITDAELAEGEKEPVVFWRGGERPQPRPPIRLRTDFDGNTDDVNTAPPLDGPPAQ
jgi:hypothetical protein